MLWAPKLKIILTSETTIEGLGRADGATWWEGDFNHYFLEEVQDDCLVDLLLGKVTIMGEILGEGLCLTLVGDSYLVGL